MYNQLLQKKIKYNEKLVRRSIIVVRHSTNRRTSDKHKMFLTYSLSSIIVKNVNNFFNLLKDVDKVYIIHEKDDIVAECYVMLNKCIENFNVRMTDKKFYFYFNKSLSTGLWRLKEKVYNKNKTMGMSDFSEIAKYEQSTFTHNNQYPLLLQKNFSDREILIMQSKIDEEKIADCCKKLEITRGEYYKILLTIKSKINRKYLT